MARVTVTMAGQGTAIQGTAIQGTAIMAATLLVTADTPQRMVPGTMALGTIGVGDRQARRFKSDNERSQEMSATFFVPTCICYDETRAGFKTVRFWAHSCPGRVGRHVRSWRKPTLDCRPRAENRIAGHGC
jgi:hypothetical protein